MCQNTDKKIEVLFQKVAREVYNNNKKTEGNNEEVVSDFNALMCKIPSLSLVLCEDQYFGIVKIEQNSCCKWETIPVYLNEVNDKEKQSLISDRISKQKKIKDYDPSNNLRTIAIVLESPHTDEFLNGQNGWTAIGPACGTTGENLYKWLPEVLMNYVPCKVDSKTATATYNEDGAICPGEYKVKLINAIQYQCSLGQETTEYRDAVFSKMWNDEEGAVKEFLRKRLNEADPKVIINCCTKGYKIKEEKDELRRLVQKEINAYNEDENCLLLRAAHPSSYHFKNGLSWVDEGKA